VVDVNFELFEARVGDVHAQGGQRDQLPLLRLSAEREEHLHAKYSCAYIAARETSEQRTVRSEQRAMCSELRTLRSELRAMRSEQRAVRSEQ
jgi:hypothetical protein